MSRHYPIRPIFDPPSSRRTSRTRFWRRRRMFAGCLVLLMLLAPLALLGWYGWRMIDAVGDAQSSAVRELPTRDVSQSASPAVGPVPASDAAPSDVEVARGLFGLGRGSSGDLHDVWKDSTSTTALVIGMDTSASVEEPETVILVRIDIQHDRVNAVSLPPNLIMSNGKSLRATYADARQRAKGEPIAGVIALRDVVEIDLRVPVNDYVLVDFAGIAKAIDQSGGVTVDVPATVSDRAYRGTDGKTRSVTVNIGQQHLDGETALAYARMNPTESSSTRIDRQMRVLTALLREYRHVSSVTRLADALMTLRGTLYTSYSWDEQLALASFASTVDSSKVTMEALDESSLTAGSQNGRSTLRGDMTTIRNEVHASLLGSSDPAATPAGT